MSQFWWQAALKLGMMSRSQHTVRFGRGYDEPDLVAGSIKAGVVSRSQHTVRFGRGYDEPDLVAGALKLGMMSRLSAHCAIWERR